MWPRNTTAAGGAMAAMGLQMAAMGGAMAQQQMMQQQACCAMPMGAPMAGAQMAQPVMAAAVVEPQAMDRGVNVADELAKLANMKQQGILNDAEFEAAKAKLLST